MRILTLVLLCLSGSIMAQHKLNGYVFDIKQNTPIAYATVYINGTSNGTVTNTDGYFELNATKTVYQLIISHLSYNTEMIDSKLLGEGELKVALTLKNINIGQVDIEDKNLRAQNIERFKKAFIGYDSWGQSAILRNDSVLTFVKTISCDTVDIQVLLVNGEQVDSSIIVNNETLFSVSASSPLIIDLPELGYTLHNDLLHFSIDNFQDRKRMSSLGYYYFHATEQGSKWQTKRIAHKRQKAYYNSPQHFTHALFNHSLPQNGYVIFERVSNDSTRKNTPRH